MTRLAGLAGTAAVVVWTFLAGLTAASTLVRPDTSTVALTLTVAAAFFLIASMLAWRAMSVVVVCSEQPKTSAKWSLALSEVVTAVVMFLLGVLLITAVLSRVLGEGLPLFG
jgi:hypothetical protein